MSINKVILIGRLGQDPELKTFDNGGKIANVSIATSEKWTDKNTGEQKEATEWHRVVFNDRLADVVAQYLRKGSQIYVEGSLKTRKYTDNNGIERYSTEVRAVNMQMLGSRNDAQQGYQPQGGYPQQAPQQGGYPQPQFGGQNPTLQYPQGVPPTGQPQQYAMDGRHPIYPPQPQMPPQGQMQDEMPF